MTGEPLENAFLKHQSELSAAGSGAPELPPRDRGVRRP
jgi:hypothetical protein